MSLTFTAMCPDLEVESGDDLAVTLQEAVWVLGHHEDIPLHLGDAVRVVTDHPRQVRLLQLIQLGRRKHPRVLIPEPEI